MTKETISLSRLWQQGLAEKHGCSMPCLQQKCSIADSYAYCPIDGHELPIYRKTFGIYVDKVQSEETHV